jgi:hypothetical protein
VTRGFICLQTGSGVVPVRRTLTIQATAQISPGGGENKSDSGGEDEWRQR